MLFHVPCLTVYTVYSTCLQMDRPALNGFEIVEQLEKEFGLQSYPINW